METEEHVLKKRGQEHSRRLDNKFFPRKEDRSTHGDWTTGFPQREEIIFVLISLMQLEL